MHWDPSANVDTFLRCRLRLDERLELFQHSWFLRLRSLDERIKLEGDLADMQGLVDFMKVGVPPDKHSATCLTEHTQELEGKAVLGLRKARVVPKVEARHNTIADCWVVRWVLERLPKAKARVGSGVQQPTDGSGATDELAGNEVICTNPTYDLPNASIRPRATSIPLFPRRPPPSNQTLLSPTQRHPTTAKKPSIQPVVKASPVPT